MNTRRFLWIPLAAAFALGAASPRTFSPPPTMTMSPFSPNPVQVDSPSVAKLLGTARSPVKLDPESQVTLVWTWKIDRVQFKSPTAADFVTALQDTYEATFSGSGGADPNALLLFTPRRAGDWKVTLHGIATFTNTHGETLVGTTEQHEGTLTAAPK